MKTLTLIPAYGRDYTTAKAVRGAWHADRDFIIACAFSTDDGRPINRPQADAEGITVNIRFKAQAQICVIKPGSKAPTLTAEQLAIKAATVRFAARPTRQTNSIVADDILHDIIKNGI